MKKSLLPVLIIFLTINLTFAQTKRAMSVDDLWAMKRISNFDISPDGKVIAFQVTSFGFDTNKGNSDIMLIDTDGKNIRAFKATEKNESNPTFVNDREITFEKEGQIWICELDGRGEVLITDLYTGASGSVWSSDGSKFLFVSSVHPGCLTQECNKQKDEEYDNRGYEADIFDELLYRHWNSWRGLKRSHLFLFDVVSKNYFDLIPQCKADAPPIALGSSNDYSISPDGKEAAFAMNSSEFPAASTNNDIFITSLENKNDFKPIKISVSGGNDNQPIYSPDGKYIAFCSMARAGFEADKQTIIIYNRKTGALVDLTASIDMSAGEIVWSADSRYIYFTAANTIYNSIFRINVTTKKLETIVEEGVNSSIKISGDGNILYYLRQSATQPSEIFSLDLKQNKSTQITKINEDVLSGIEWNNIETFWSDGAEGAKVQSILIKPPFFNPEKKYPMIFLIHGGPQGHWSDNFHYRWNTQMFASQGYVVVAPNPRGSVGYGQLFTDQISQDWGGKVYEDLMNAYDYSAKNFPFIDTENTFAAGASYGGYMIAWIAGHTNRFNALVCHAGVYNLESMYGSTEELWFPEWEFGGAPWENRELYQRWSPHMYAKNFKTPTLVVHGAFDFRVPESQAFEFFTTLQRLGVKSRFLYYPDETHFVAKPRNARLWWNTIFDWFEENKTEE